MPCLEMLTNTKLVLDLRKKEFKLVGLIDFKYQFLKVKLCYLETES